MNKTKETVSIVGSGITSTMVALKLLEEGYEITMYSKGTDSRQCRHGDHYGSTGNGAIGRFISGFEGEPYLSDTPMYPKMQWAFTHPISEGGWLAKPFHEFSEKDQIWLRRRYDAASNQEAVRSLLEDYYVSKNRDSIAAWKDLQKTQPDLFAGTDCTSPEQGILRLYDNQKLFDTTVAMHRQHGFLKEPLSIDEVVRRFPCYRSAAENGFIAGGLIAEGFSLNIHQFVDNVLNYLESKGANLIWNTDVKRIDTDNGVVKGLVTDKEYVYSDHYSINVGAYGGELLKGTTLEDRIGGVAGRWLIIPRPKEYDMPTKIHGDKREGFPVTDNNLTPFSRNGQRMFAVGGGYLYVGSDTNQDNLAGNNALDLENERTIRIYFGDFYTSAKQKGQVELWPKTCIRSFTFDDNPVHEVMETSNEGILTITAGTNTGTITIAPYLAKWTLDKLKRE